jgi:hypothetical protein
LACSVRRTETSSTSIRIPGMGEPRTRSCVTKRYAKTACALSRAASPDGAGRLARTLGHCEGTYSPQASPWASAGRRPPASRAGRPWLPPNWAGHPCPRPCGTSAPGRAGADVSGGRRRVGGPMRDLASGATRGRRRVGRAQQGKKPDEEREGEGRMAAGTDTPERDTPGLQMPMDCGRLF